ncbi:hypothetical protein GSI_11616 [Ganoderma sinense ZZ0214-1]|uniref:Uncharacterized protein n=1 Tax=Ganoderma sinense ZZ0214-1 TaxID=1077348 RepID=A0A2G8RWH2_9APHY|nr:hypothetical protein GSI_11616 [Ganoderma sinense ZZ0214-1]
MGLGRVVATAAAATPLIQDYIRRHPSHMQDDFDDLDDRSQAPSISAASHPPQPVSQILHGRDPESLVQSSSQAVVTEEMARRPLLGVDVQASRQSPGASGQGYGSVLNEGGLYSLRTSPERYRSNPYLDRVPEEAALLAGDEEDDEEEDEWNLEQQGFYSGSYKRTLALYAFVPLTALVFFIFFALCPTWFWPIRWPTPPTFPRSLPSPLPEFILAMAFWSLAHLLRTPLWFISSRICPRILDTILFNASYVLLSTLLRIAALAALRVRHEMTYTRPIWRDEAFRAVWWLGLGWGFAEAAVSITQGYQQLACYRTVMVPVDRVKEILAQSRATAQWGIGSGSINTSREHMPLSPRGAESPAADGLANSSSHPNSNGLGSANGGLSRSGSGSGRRPSDAHPMSLEEAVRLAVDHDVEQLLYLQEREELEEVYGVPVIYIPVFVPCLQRVDSFLFSLGFTLVLAWAYLLSPLSFPPGADPMPIYSNHALEIAFPIVVVVHLCLSLLHSPLVLPRLGVHTAAYVGLLVSLGGFFTGLGLWGALA